MAIFFIKLSFYKDKWLFADYTKLISMHD